jgi:hypothetical protein
MCGHNRWINKGKAKLIFEKENWCQKKEWLYFQNQTF